jgi:short chain dehydrogenase
MPRLSHVRVTEGFGMLLGDQHPCDRTLCVLRGRIHVCNPLRRRRPPNLLQRTLASARPDGRVAFVTGGTRGIGAAICHSLMGQGATVAAGYSRDREKAEALLSRTERAWGTGQRSHSSGSSAMWARGLDLSRHLCGPERSVNSSVTNCQAPPVQRAATRHMTSPPGRHRGSASLSARPKRRYLQAMMAFTANWKPPIGELLIPREVD